MFFTRDDCSNDTFAQTIEYANLGRIEEAISNGFFTFT